MVLALSWPSSSTGWIVLGASAGTLSIVLLYFIVSRRGESRAVTKCAVLSIWAHVILLGFLYLMDWIPDSVGKPGAGRDEVQVQWVAESFDEVLDAGSEAAEESAHDDPQPEYEDADTESLVQELEQVPSAEDDIGDTEVNVTVESPVPPVADAPEELIAQDMSDAGADLPRRDEDAEYLLTATAVSEPAPQADALDTAIDVDVADLEVNTRLVSRVKPVALPPKYQGRTSENRRRLAEAGGGSLDTEAAVDAALDWLMRAQSTAQGRWDNLRWEGGVELRSLPGATGSVRADTAMTGLALLAFLGAGHTHHSGAYADTVRQGLNFLVQSQSLADGNLSGNASHFAAMYCHGIATLAVSEAYIMTRDPKLRPVMERAIEYTIQSQHLATGGWRYRPGDSGDTSQFGWQVMALVSAESAGMVIPHKTWEGARRWLQRVSLGPAGGLACYTPDRPVPSASMTAEASVCRAFLKSGAHPIAQNEAVTYIARRGSRHDALNDLYFSYYATLALFQRQDDHWKKWNLKLSTHLLKTQRSRGPSAGSWDPNTKWGKTGGRVYTTAMACLCLETYYRYLPVYSVAVQRGSEMLR